MTSDEEVTRTKLGILYDVAEAQQETLGRQSEQLRQAIERLNRVSDELEEKVQKAARQSFDGAADPLKATLDLKAERFSQQLDRATREATAAAAQLRWRAQLAVLVVTVLVMAAAGWVAYQNGQKYAQLQQTERQLEQYIDWYHTLRANNVSFGRFENDGGWWIQVNPRVRPRTGKEGIRFLLLTRVGP